MPQEPREPTSAFRADLQGLRALAILLVVLCHAGVPGFSGGYIGVDVFFVLSGYLITRLLLRELNESGRIALMGFYARRLRRLVPAMAAMLLVMTGVTLWLLSEREAYARLASTPYAATWTSNLYFAFSNFGYFDELATKDVFLHTWSLAVEEQFYLIWPLALIVMFLIARRKRTAGIRIGVPTTLGFIALASFTVSLYWTSRAPHSAYYLMPSRVWQFALGAMVCLSFRNIFSASRSPLILGTGLALIIASATLLHGNLAYPGYWALFPSLGAVLVIAAGHERSENHTSLLTHPIAVWLGDRSYSWYLWHWPVLVLGFPLGFEGQPIPILSLVLLSLLAAMISYRFIELPFWKGRFSIAVPRRTILTSLLVIVSTVAVSLYGMRSLSHMDTGAEWRADLPVIYPLGCDAWYEHARVEPCVFGSSQASKTVVLVGDSIGAQWFSAVPEVFPGSDWRTVVFTKSACAMVDEEYFYRRIGTTYDVCTQWRNAVIDEIISMKPDVVIVGSSPRYDFTEAQWTDGSARIFEKLSKQSTNVFVIAGTPNLGFNGPACLSRNYDNSCRALNRTEHADRVSRYLENAAKNFPRVHVFDFNDVVCPNDVCSALSDDGLLVFRDGQHLADTFVRGQIPRIRERLSAAL